MEGAKVQLPPEDYSREIIGTRTEQRVKMNRMRLRIAERLKDAQNTNAMLTTFNELDMRFNSLCIYDWYVIHQLIFNYFPLAVSWNSVKLIRRLL